jgi:hypothetical protein
MKHLVFLFAVLAVLHTHAQATFFDRADAFFKKNVTEGRVNYAGIKKNPAELTVLVKEIETMRLTDTDPKLKAFLINAYNLLVIKQVVDLYPIKGPLAVDGFFSKTSFKVMGVSMTLDQLEKGTLYKKFPDPRLHFVLVCAAKGCPPLVNYSFKPEIQEQQLTDRTRQVLNLDWFIRVQDSKVEISQIFSWYEADFLSKTSTVLGYINTYRSKKINEKSSLAYYEYDWLLNE